MDNVRAMTDFPPAEMSDRLRRIRSQMASEGLGAFISTDASSVRYATGFRGEPRMLLLTADLAVLYTAFRTIAWAQRQTRGIELSTCDDPLGDALDRLGNSCMVGVDSGISHAGLITMQQRLGPHAVSPSPAIDLARQIKSEMEIERLRQSQQLNEAVFSAVLPRIRPGMTERAVQGLILSEIAGRENLDGYAFPPIVAAGANAWEIHHLPDATPLQLGDMVIIDLGVVHRGYASDMTRTICLGEPTDRMQEVYDCVSAAQDRAFDAIRPGVSNHEVDAAAREVIERAGHGKGFTHGLGHGIGLQTHDPGILLSTRAPKLPLESGMAFTIEPGVYLEGEFGVRIEDTIIVRPAACENLTHQSKSLICLPF